MPLPLKKLQPLPNVVLEALNKVWFREIPLLDFVTHGQEQLQWL